VDLAAGDSLVLYTDGATEATNAQGKPFGTERLAEVVRRSSAASAEVMVQTILGDITAFADGRALADDVTLLVLRAS
jgi:sigma-B regulation protein RsbU (phosphoserine phosphatase)